MTGRWSDRFGPAYWQQFGPTPQSARPPIPRGAYGAMPGAPVGWYGGMAPRAVPPEQWPAPMPASGGYDPSTAGDGGVNWAQAGSRERPLISEWRPPEEDLTRWGVEVTLPVVPHLAQAPDTMHELIRLTMPIPTGVTCMVWARQLTGNVSIGVAVEIKVGIGTIQVPVTPLVPLALDNIARFLAPNDARQPAAAASMPLVMPARWLSVNARYTQQADQDSQIVVGAMAAPISAIG